MPIQITIDDVPEAVRDELARRAAARGQSLEEYLQGELLGLAGRPDLKGWLKRVRDRKDASPRLISSEAILRARDMDRR